MKKYKTSRNSILSILTSLDSDVLSDLYSSLIRYKNTPYVSNKRLGGPIEGSGGDNEYYWRQTLNPDFIVRKYLFLNWIIFFLIIPVFLHFPHHELGYCA
jgi:hypothetical protein